jgi:hypothetical protein
MTHYKALIETQFLGQWDLPPDRDAIVVIEKVERYVPERPKKGDKKNKLLISFRGKRKPWLSAPTTQKTIAKLYGVQIENWIGKPIALYVDPSVEFGGEVTGGIRVRPRPPTRGAQPTSDPLDRPADEEKVAQIDHAREQSLQHPEGPQPPQEGSST